MKNTSKRDPLIESIIEGLMTGRQSEVLKNVYSRRVPLLRYKMNDSVIKFKGQRIPVEGLFKFIKRGDSYLPKFSTKEEKGDRVIDMTPFICVGVFIPKNKRDFIKYFDHLLYSMGYEGRFDELRLSEIFQIYYEVRNCIFESLTYKPVVL